MFLKSFAVTINKEKWKVHLITDKLYKEKFKNGLAITMYRHSNPKCRELYFRPGFRTKSIILHEIVHAYTSYMHAKYPEMTKSELEEAMCDVVAMNIYSMIKVADNIEYKLKKRV